MKNKNFRELLYTMLSIIILLIFWKVVSLIIDKEILVPSPEKTFIEIINIIQSAYFIPSLVNTLKRALVGFIMAVGIGIFLGMMGGLFKPIYYLLRPIVLVNKAVPTMAMILLALIWLESEKAPVLVGFVVIFPIIYENVVQGIRNVDVKLIEMMKIYDVSRWDMIKELYIPSMRTYLYGAMTAAMGLNLKIIIAAEVLSQPRISMGTSFQIEKVNLNTAGVFAWSLITIVLAGVLEQTLRIMRRN
ncbi:ABC transporter permease [Anaerosolibacter sp.]|uniref:ABC transporter permease n=1 Tax=Anaerosolibacter sp. TaxID=1872527 RepID=UPI0039EF4CBA